MPRTEIYLSSLTVGRCFTLPIDDGDRPAKDEGGGSDAIRRADSILPGKAAWKVTATDGETYTARNVAGEEQTFQGEIKVVEIPREGFERLVERSAE
jgi:hypothetical protein